LAGDVTTDADGNIFVAGSLAAGAIDFGGGVRSVSSRSAFIAAFDAAGEYRWDRIFTEATVVDQLVVDPDGSLLIAGEMEGPVDFAGRPLPAPVSYYFAKLDVRGEPVWSKTWPALQVAGPLILKWMNLRLFDTDGCGDVFLAGTTDDASAAALGVPSGGLFVAAYTRSGDRLWGKTFGGEYSDQYATIAVDDEGDIFLSGNAGISPDEGPNGSMTVVSFGGEQAPLYYLAKLDAKGDLRWVVDLNPDLVQLESPALLGVDAAGEAIVFTQDDSTTEGVQWFDASGNEAAKATLPPDLVGDGGFTAGAITPSGSVLLAGGVPGATTADLGHIATQEVGRDGTILWSWSSQPVAGPLVGVAALGAGGRPLIAGRHFPVPSAPSLFMGFDASFP
jgi:outer membrane protein assembly factor BamB